MNYIKNEVASSISGLSSGPWQPGLGWGCTKRSTAGWLREEIIPLCSLHSLQRNTGSSSEPPNSSQTSKHWGRTKQRPPGWSEQMPDGAGLVQPGWWPCPGLPLQAAPASGEDVQETEPGSSVLHGEKQGAHLNQETLQLDRRKSQCREGGHWGWTGSIPGGSQQLTGQGLEYPGLALYLTLLWAGGWARNLLGSLPSCLVLQMLSLLGISHNDYFFKVFMAVFLLQSVRI